MKKLVLIDGINFYFKGSFVGQLSVNGKKVQYIYAFLKNFISLTKLLQKKDEQVIFVICWDGGYKERTRISQQAVQKGLIPKAYKQERRQAQARISDEQRAQKEQFVKQMKQVQELFEYTRIRQLRVIGQQADDLIGSYVYKYKDEFDEIIVVTSDKDYYQLLQPNVKIYNSHKKVFLDCSYLKSEYNLDNNQQWIDVGALAGQTGASSDSIYGVPGISYKTGSKLISKYSTLDKLLETTKNYFAKNIEEYGSLKEFINAVQSKTYNLKQMKKQLKVLQYQQVVKLAYQLKKMRTFLQVEIKENKSDWQYIDNYMKQHKFMIKQEDIDKLLIQNFDSSNKTVEIIQDDLF